MRVIGEALEGDDSPARTAAAFSLLKRVPLTTAVVGPRHAEHVVFNETARRLSVRPRHEEIDLYDEDAPPPMTERFAAAAVAMYALADAPPAVPSVPRAVANADTGRESAGAVITG